MLHFHCNCNTGKNGSNKEEESDNMLLCLEYHKAKFGDETGFLRNA